MDSKEFGGTFWLSALGIVTAFISGALVYAIKLKCGDVNVNEETFRKISNRCCWMITITINRVIHLTISEVFHCRILDCPINTTLDSMHVLQRESFLINIL